MSPYIGAVAGYPIPVFAVALDLGLLCGLTVTLALARRRGVAPRAALDTAMLVLVAALLGGRAWYVATHWADYAASPTAVFALWEGGLALPGAVLAGALATPFAARAMRVATPTIADAGAIGAPLGQAIGRLGCIPSGCAAGKPLDELWAGVPTFVLPDASGALAPRFPSQPLEAACELALALALWRVWRGGARPGVTAGLYLAGYVTIWVAAQPFRT